MKKRSYAPIPVEWRETVDNTTGERSRMPMRVQRHVPDYGALYLAAYDRLSEDPRMTLTAWKVLAKLIGHLALRDNLADVTQGQLIQRTGLSQQSISQALTVLRQVGALAPSQAFGKYHLSVTLIYRGRGSLRETVRLRQERGRTR